MSVEYRRDHRSVEEFAVDVEFRTICETYIGRALQLDFTERGFACEINELGVDNTGQLIEGNLPHHQQDKEFLFADGSSRKLEIASIPVTCTSFMTFKSFKIQQCLDDDAGLIVYRHWDYFFYETEAFRWMCDNLQVRTDYSGQGGKPCMRIQWNDLMQLIKQKAIFNPSWKPKAQEYINDNAHIIFAPKQEWAAIVEAAHDGSLDSLHTVTV